MLVYTVADYTSALHSEPYDCSVGHVCAPPWRSKVVLHQWWVMYLLHQSLLHLRVYFTSSTKCGGSHTCSTSLWWIIDLHTISSCALLHQVLEQSAEFM